MAKQISNMINAIYRIFIVASDFLAPAAYAEVSKHVDAFLLQYHWLAHHSMHRGHVCYHMTAKFHMLWHICQMSKFLNPKLVWCYSFESFIGKMARSAAACVAGTSMPIIGEKVANNFLIALQLDMACEMRRQS